MSYEIIDKGLQYFSKPYITANRVILVPYYANSSADFGEISINGSIEKLNRIEELVPILTAFSKVKAEV
jgi:hypothetical protein